MVLLAYLKLLSPAKNRPMPRGDIPGLNIGLFVQTASSFEMSRGLASFSEWGSLLGSTVWVVQRLTGRFRGRGGGRQERRAPGALQGGTGDAS